MDESQLAALYQQYLGRAPDPSGIATWSGQDPAAVIAGIQGSQEYANNQANQGGGGGGGGGDGGGGGGGAPQPNLSDPQAALNSIYQSILGRAPDPGSSGWLQALQGGADPQEIARQIASSSEGRSYASSNPSGQFSGLASLSQGNAPTFDNANYNNLQFLGGQNINDTTQYQYKDEKGGTVTVDANGNPTGYIPGPSWYEQQLAAHPDAIRKGYRNMDYLATGPLDQTYNLNGVNVPITQNLASENLIDPSTGKLYKDASGNYVPIYKEPDRGTSFDNAMTNYIVPGGIALATAMVGGEMLAPYFGAGAEAAGAGDVFAGWSPTGSAAGTAGSQLTAAEIAALNAGAAGSGSWGLSPELAADLGLDYSTSGLATDGVLGSEALEALGLNSGAAAGGLTLADLLTSLKTGSSLLGTGSSIASLANRLTGGSTGTAKSTLNPYGAGYGAGYGDINTTNLPNITADLTKGNANFTLGNAPAAAPAQLYSAGNNPAIKQGYAEGGEVEDHNPSFFSEGGLGTMENRYVKGEGDGTSDSVAAMLADGEFVIPADVVSKLGNGSNDAGANVLDEFMAVIREHAQKHDPRELPPDSKGPLQYLAEANTKAQA